jgi:hypothetical protein
VPPRLDEILQTRRNGAYRGQDVFSRVSTHEMDFWQLTGETVTSFQHIVNDVRPLLGNDDGAGRPNLLSAENRLLMFYYWVKKYPDIVEVATLFDVGRQTVSRHLLAMIDILWEYFQTCISWPTDEEWLQMRGNWETIHDAVGAIDGTVHTVEMPAEDTHLFYSGHVHRYCMSTQIIMDNLGNIRYIHVSTCIGLRAQGTLIFVVAFFI